MFVRVKIKIKLLPTSTFKRWFRHILLGPYKFLWLSQLASNSLTQKLPEPPTKFKCAPHSRAGSHDHMDMTTSARAGRQQSSCRCGHIEVMPAGREGRTWNQVCLVIELGLMQNTGSRLPTWGWLSPGLAKKANEKERLKCATSLAHRAKNRRSKAELARCFCCCPTPLLHGPEIPACCWLFVLGCWLLCPVMVCRLCHKRPPSTGDMFFLAEMYLMEALHCEKLFGAK